MNGRFNPRVDTIRAFFPKSGRFFRFSSLPPPKCVPDFEAALFIRGKRLLKTWWLLDEMHFFWLMWIDFVCWCRILKSTENKLLIISIIISWTIVFEKAIPDKMVCLSYSGPAAWNTIPTEKKVEYFPIIHSNDQIMAYIKHTALYAAYFGKN